MVLSEHPAILANSERLISLFSLIALMMAVF